MIPPRIILAVIGGLIVIALGTLAGGVLLCMRSNCMAGIALFGQTGTALGALASLLANSTGSAEKPKGASVAITSADGSTASAQEGKQ